MNVPSPKVTVGMPVYNGAEYIRTTLDSILAQTFKDFELVISDNASTDGTQSICEEYARQDKRIRYIRNASNIGASDNYNAVFINARAPYFKWASSNDICHPEFLEKCVKTLDENPNVVVVSPRTKLFENSPDDAQEYHDNLNLQQDNACSRFIAFLENCKLNNVMNGMIRSDALKKTAMIKTFYSSDTSLMAELTLHGKFIELPDYMFYRRMDPRTATKLKSETDVLRHYDPNLKNLMLFQNWKIHFEYCKAMLRAPVRFSERMCLMKFFLRHLIWNRQKLLGDFTIAIKKWRTS